MGIFDKVKNFFYEDVEDETVEEPRVIKKEKEPIKEEKKKEEPVNNDISEMELFKSERTFNFPMDLGDDIFDEEKEEPVVTKKKEEVKKEYSRESRNLYSSSYSGISKAKLTAEPKDEEQKKFRPTPVVSPVYGILDKNYTVEDVVDKNLSKTKEFSLEKKTVDFDTVRNRAYKELDEEIEKTLTGSKDIFFNLDEDNKETEEENDDFDEEKEVVITYDEEVKSNEEDSIEPDIEIPVVKRKSKTKVKEKDSKEEKEDLFNLIDNMYKDDDEEEED